MRSFALLQAPAPQAMPPPGVHGVYAPAGAPQPGSSGPYSGYAPPQQGMYPTPSMHPQPGMYPLPGAYPWPGKQYPPEGPNSEHLNPAFGYLPPPSQQQLQSYPMPQPKANMMAVPAYTGYPNEMAQQQDPRQWQQSARDMKPPQEQGMSRKQV